MDNFVPRNLLVVGKGSVLEYQILEVGIFGKEYRPAVCQEDFYKQKQVQNLKIYPDVIHLIDIVILE